MNRSGHTFLSALAMFLLFPCMAVAAVSDNAPGAANLKWKYDAGFGITGAPVVYDGKVFVGDGEGTLHVVNAATGQLVWTYKGGATINGAPAIMNGVVYIGGRDGSLSALGAANGDVRWEYTSKTVNTPGAI